MILYRTPGRSFTRPPRTSTIECSCRLWPTPGMEAVTSMPLVRRTRATLRSAEFGFFGVVVYTRVQTPRRWGEPFNAGVLVFSTLSSRPLRTSWLIVGMGGLDLLPALGRALKVCFRAVVPGGAGPARASRPGSPATVRPTRSGVSPSPGTGRCRRTGLGRPSRLGATLPGLDRGDPGDQEAWPLVTQAHREREQAQGTLGTADDDTRGEVAGANRVPMSIGTHVRTRWSGLSPGPNTGRPGTLPDRPHTLRAGADSTSPLSVTAGIRQRGSAPVARPDTVAEGRRRRGRRR